MTADFTYDTYAALLEAGHEAGLTFLTVREYLDDAPLPAVSLVVPVFDLASLIMAGTVATRTPRWMVFLSIIWAATSLAPVASPAICYITRFVRCVRSITLAISTRVTLGPGQYRVATDVEFGSIDKILYGDCGLGILTVDTAFLCR
jgi:hypothetical protein